MSASHSTSPLTGSERRRPNIYKLVRPADPEEFGRRKGDGLTAPGKPPSRDLDAWRKIAHRASIVQVIAEPGDFHR